MPCGRADYTNHTVRSPGKMPERNKEELLMKTKLTRLWSFLLALVMVLALMPQMVFAEGNTSTAPSVSAYATKTQLMDGTFAPNADGTAVNYGKIVFGKNSSGASQEWYILQ